MSKDMDDPTEGTFVIAKSFSGMVIGSLSFSAAF
jgi:hypothetical protein